jgi:hypothetical protein
MRPRVASVLSVIAIAAIAVAAFVAAQERLESRPERDDVNSVDYARVRIRTHFGLDEGIVMESVWAYCHATVDGTRLARPITRLGDEEFELVLEPSMGQQARRRFRGCVNDGIVDRAKTQLVSLERVPRAEAGI